MKLDLSGGKRCALANWASLILNLDIQLSHYKQMMKMTRMKTKTKKIIFSLQLHSNQHYRLPLRTFFYLVLLGLLYPGSVVTAKFLMKLNYTVKKTDFEHSIIMHLFSLLVPPLSFLICVGSFITVETPFLLQTAEASFHPSAIEYPSSIWTSKTLIFN